MELNKISPVVRISACKNYFIFLGAVFAAGFITSFFIDVSEDSPFCGVGDVYYIYTVNFKPSYIFIRLVCDLAVIALICLSGLIIYSMPLHFFLICYKGFLTGVAVRVLISSYYAGGLFVCIAVILPSFLFCAFSYAAQSCFSYYSIFKDTVKRKFSCICSDVFFCACICVLALVYEVVISMVLLRPLNYYF